MSPLPAPAPIPPNFPVGETIAERLEIGVAALFDRDLEFIDEQRRDDAAARPFNAEREYATERYR